MTTISEKEYDKKIVVSATKFTCDDVDTTIPKPLPQKGGFAMIVVGRPGYGKTSLINSLVCKSGKNLNRKFDRVYVWSPSMITMEGDPYELIPESQKFGEATYWVCKKFVIWKQRERNSGSVVGRKRKGEECTQGNVCGKGIMQRNTQRVKSR